MGILKDRMDDMEAKIQKLKKRVKKLENTLADIAVLASSKEQESFESIAAEAQRALAIEPNIEKEKASKRNR
jgi:hypothetical protein